MRQVIVIPGKLANLNDYTKACRGNRYGGAEMKRANQEIVQAAIKAARLEPVAGKVDIHTTWIEPNMRRDKDNIRFALKFILDALVAEGILPNDGWKNIGNLSDSFCVNKTNPRIGVTLEEA